MPSSVIRQGPWKLIETFDPAGTQLYHLANDIGETRDLASGQPALAARLRRELAAWRRRVGAQMMSPNPDFDPARPTSRERKQ